VTTDTGKLADIIYSAALNGLSTAALPGRVLIVPKEGCTHRGNATKENLVYPKNIE